MKLETMSTDGNGMMWVVPSMPRMRSERTVIPSTVPVIPATVTTSPSLMAFSIWMNAPVMMSFTRVCAPKEMARPTTPAPAISGPMSTPISDRESSRAMTRITTVEAFRNSWNSVRSRAVTIWPERDWSLRSTHDMTASQIMKATTTTRSADP